jgi:hypothetical protein
MIYIESKKKAIKNITKLYPNAIILDVTSKAKEPYVKISPFYPHGNIPVPFSEGYFASSVEGIWQGLKVFENDDVDISKFSVNSMKGLKRTIRKFGNPLGHRKGVNGTELLDYITARRQIYLPSYAFLLEKCIPDLIQKLKELAFKQDLVLLDFETNVDIDNPHKPLSHAGLVKRYLEKKYPELKDLKFELKFVISKQEKVKTKGQKSKPATKRTKKKKEDKNQMKLF